VAILLICLFFLKGRYRNEAFNILYVLNTLVAWCYLVCLLHYLSELFVAWYGQNMYEWFYFKKGYNPVDEKWFIVRMFLPLLAGLFFFFRAARTNRLVTFVFLILSNLGLIEQIWLLVNKVYLPSRWEMNDEAAFTWVRLVRYFIISILLLLVYRRAARKGRLQQPSVFLK